jgi:hypothetical protein
MTARRKLDPCWLGNNKIKAGMKGKGEIARVKRD